MKFIPYFICLLLPRLALATTFGSIALVTQVENTQYIAEGTIHSSSVQLEPSSKLPFTYYFFTIINQQKGDALPRQIQVRSPGGEIDGKGYHVAGAVTFSEEEEVILYLKDTNEDNVKEVTGLTSGKFTKKTEGTQSYLINGLGFPVTGTSGEKLSLKEFVELISRAANGQATLADRIIMLNDGNPHPETTFTGTAITGSSEQATAAKNTDSPSAKSVNLPGKPTDKSPKGSSGAHWQIGLRLAFMAILTVVAILYFRRMRE